MRLAYFKVDEEARSGVTEKFSKTFQTRYIYKFGVTLTNFLQSEHQFLTGMFSDPKLQSLLPKFYDTLLAAILSPSKEKLLTEFIYGLPLEDHQEAFNDVILPMLECVK